MLGALVHSMFLPSLTPEGNRSFSDQSISNLSLKHTNLEGNFTPCPLSKTVIVPYLQPSRTSNLQAFDQVIR